MVTRASLPPTRPDVPEGALGSTVMPLGTSGFRVVCPRASVAAASVSGSSFAGRNLPGQGAVVSWSVVASGRSVDARCGTAKRDGATCPGHPDRRSPVPGGTGCERPAHQPRLVRWGCPCRPFLPEQGWPRSPSCLAQCAVQPALVFVPGHPEGCLAAIMRTRRRGGVPPSGARAAVTRGWLVAVAGFRWLEDPDVLSRAAAFGLRQRLPFRSGIRVNHRPSQGFHHVKERSEKSVPLGG